jgi:exopolysaccharide biosynthesis polyprenyl glycosylphosphotransferase
MAKMPKESPMGLGETARFLSSLPANGREGVPLELDLSDRTLREVAPAEPHRGALAPSEGPGPFPSWLRAIDALHRMSRSPFVAAIDLLVMFGAGIAARVPSLQAGLLTGLFVFAFYITGKYADRGSLETQGVLWFLADASMPMAIVTLVAAGLQGPLHWSVALTLRTAAAAAVALIVAKGISWFLIVRSRRRGFGMRRTLVMGDATTSDLVVRKLTSYPEAGLAPVASLGLATDAVLNGNGHMMAAARLARIVRDDQIDEVVLAPEGADGEILRAVKAADGLDTNFSILLPLSEVFLHPGLVTQVGGLPLISLGRIAQSQKTLPGKRLFDVALATLAMVALSPLLGAAALAIKIFDGGPVIYKQRRVGRGGKPFQLLKFRSMVVGAERLIVDLRDRNANTGLLFKVYDDPRITPLGRIIRRLSVDELPQLWNVVRGDMSLVGPRPLAVEPEDFGPVENKRHSVLPGITGYWQIAGCNDLNYEEMIKLDLAYIQNRSLFLDIRLLLRTPAALVHRRGPW